MMEHQSIESPQDKKSNQEKGNSLKYKKDDEIF